MQGPVEELCRRVYDWEINHELKDLPAEIWDFLKKNGFFGMIIPKRYGGLGFSALGHSEVVAKLTTRPGQGGRADGRDRRIDVVLDRLGPRFLPDSWKRLP